MRICRALIVVGFVAFSFFTAFNPVLALTTASASLGAPTSVDHGATSGSISIGISATPANIGSFQLQVNCSDPTVILFTGIAGGSLNPLTSYSAGSASMNNMLINPPTGGGNVATISFSAVGNPGSSATISLSGILVDFTSGNETSVSANATITINAAPTTHTLTMAAAPLGGGSVNPSLGPHIYNDNDIVPISATPAAGYQFSNWNGGVANPSSASTTVTMNSDKSITANFTLIPPPTTIQHTLTLNADGNGGFQIQSKSVNGFSSPGAILFDEGSSVNITNVPDTGWKFVNWTGDVTSSNSAITVVMNSDQTVTAHFVLATPTTTTTTPPTTSTTPPTKTTTPPTTTSPTSTATQTVTATTTVTSPPITVIYPPVTVTSPPVTTTYTPTTSATSVSTIPPFISNATIDRTKGTEADIAWTTAESSDSQVEYWASPHQVTPLDSNLVTAHSVHITGLSPTSTYHYKLMSRDSDGNLFTLELYSGGSSQPAARGINPWIIILWIASILAGILVTLLVAWPRRRQYMAWSTPSVATPPPSSVAPKSSFGTPPPTNVAPKSSFVTPPPASVAPTPSVVTPPPTSVAPTPSITGQTDLKNLAAFKTFLKGSHGDATFLKPQEIAKPVELMQYSEEPAPPRKPEETPETESAAANEISVALSKGNLTVTSNAIEKLKASVHVGHGEETRALRVTRSPSIKTQLRMFVDKKGPDDLVVFSKGVKILFLSPEAAEILGGVVIDYQETEHGGNFSLSKKNKA